MARLDPIVREADLPPVEDASRETDVFDCKARYSGDKVPFEIAKDVAAMANRLGGTILVGLSENRKSYVPGTKTEMEKLSADADAAIKDRCFPKPVVGREVIAYGAEGFVLAINVEPFIGIIGVKLLKADKSERPVDKWNGDSYVFPIRSGSQSDYLTPETLPMYMMPEVRRAVILLEAMREAPGLLCCTTLAKSKSRGPEAGKVTGVLPDENSFEFSVGTGSGPFMPMRFPLDCIRRVWKDANVWRIDLKGYFPSGSWEYLDWSP